MSIVLGLSIRESRRWVQRDAMDIDKRFPDRLLAITAFVLFGLGCIAFTAVLITTLLINVIKLPCLI